MVISLRRRGSIQQSNQKGQEAKSLSYKLCLELGKEKVLPLETANNIRYILSRQRTLFVNNGASRSDTSIKKQAPDVLAF